jgi:hypothetical protein
MEALTQPEVMKSLIKNNYGYYVIQKILQVAGENEEVKEKVGSEIDKNLQYVSDKSLKQKWMNLIN